MKTVLILLLAGSAGLWASQEKDPAPWPEPSFPPPPRLAISAEELARRRSAPEFEKLRAKALADASALLEQPVELPDGPASWVFYYANPQTGNRLVPLSAKEHRDPATGEIFTDDRTCAAHRALMHERAERAAETLAWGYAYSGDDRFATEVRRILHKLAEDYPGYPQRMDRWGRKGWFAPLGGRRYAQSLDEATGIIKLARAYDLTRNSPVFSPEDRNRIEQNLFRGTADTLLWFNVGINNHQTWYNAGLLAIASVLADADLAKKVLTMRGGFLDQLERSVGGDGLWYEGTMVYHNYALQALIEFVDAARSMGWTLDQNEKFRHMFAAPLRMAYPDGYFPAINDSDRVHLAVFDKAWRWAWETWKDPLFAQALARGDEKKLRQFPGVETAAWPPDFGSEVLPDAGMIVLRSGQGSGRNVVFLDYGPHGGGHGHFDKLNIMLFAAGREWLPDPGRLTYSHKEYKTWVKTTVAHNTVVLDGRNQEPANGRLLYLQPHGESVSAGALCDSAYPGVRLERHLLLTPEWLLDLVEVRSPKTRQVDLAMHVACSDVTPVGEPVNEGRTSAGTKNGFQHLSETVRFRPSGGHQWDFREKDRVLRAHFPPAEETVLLGHGIGYTLKHKVPTLIRRRQAADTRFLAVYDLTGSADFVRGVREEKGTVWIDARRGTVEVQLPGKERSALSFTPPTAGQ